MQVADLDTRIIIKSKTATLNEVGGEVITWSTVRAVWAQKRYKPSKEFYRSGRTFGEESVLFVIRYMGNVDVTMRVEHGSTVYNITNVNHSDDRKSWTELTCSRVY